MKVKTVSLLLGLSLVATGLNAAPSLQCGKSAEGFAFVLDASGSMMEKVVDVKKDAHLTVTDAEKKAKATRMDVVKAFMGKTAEALDAQSMASELVTVAPYAELVPSEKRSAEDFIKRLKAIPETLEVFGRPTWLGERAQKRFNQTLSQPEALVLITDGHFESKDEKMNPVKNLEAFYQANPNACLHIVSVAYRDEEKAGVDALAKVKDCAVVAHVDDLLANQDAFDQFVATVYGRECAMDIQGVKFAFDKAVLVDEESATLMAALKVLKAQPAGTNITLRGWTDALGTDAYNKALSLKRAQAVRDFFVAKGLNPQQLHVEGMGKSFKYSNETAQGRWLNRRVEILYGNGHVSKDATIR